MKQLPLLVLMTLPFLLAGCFRLDSFLYSPTDTAAYQLENANDEQELREQTSFIQVPQHLIHQFSLASANGRKIHGVFVGDTNTIAQGPVILYCHGNSGNLDNYWPRTKLLWHAMQSNGIAGSVLLFDYQGFGASEGEPTEQALYDDTHAMYQWLLEKGAQEDSLVLYGYSLGSAPATKLAYEPRDPYHMQASKLILEAPFASAEVFVQDAALLAMPGSFAVNLSINNAEEIKEVEAPLLWIHGVEDDFIPIDTHGEVVFKNYQGDGQALRVAGGKHSDVPAVYGIEQYMELISDFIKK